MIALVFMTGAIFVYDNELMIQAVY